LTLQLDIVLAVSKGNMSAKDFEGIELNLPPGTLTAASIKAGVLNGYSETDILRLVHMNLTKNVTVGECSSSCNSQCEDDEDGDGCGNELDNESEINGLNYVSTNE